MQSCLAHLLSEMTRLRKAAGLSQVQLATRIRYQPSYLSKAERGLLGVPSQGLVAAIDTELGAGGELTSMRRLAWLEDQKTRAGIPGRSGPFEEVDTTDRRQLVLAAGGLAATGADAVAPQEPSFHARLSGSTRRNPSDYQSRVDVSGHWWTAWQTFRDGEEVISAQEANLRQEGDKIRMEAITRGLDLADGGYLWWGELRIWDNEIIMGWYAADDGSVRSKGTVFLALHPHGISFSGRWVGLSYDGMFVTGWGAFAKSEEEARRAIDRLKSRGSSDVQNPPAGTRPRDGHSGVRQS